MAAEFPYRIALSAVFGLAIVIGGYHRLQAAKSSERISRREEGLWIAVPLRLGGFFLMLAALAYLVNPAWTAGVQFPLPIWIRWCGAAMGLAGCGLMYWTLTNLGKNLTDTVVTRINATLVTSGPYRFVRHPFYVTAALLMLGTTLLTANWLIAAWGLWVMTLLVIRTPKEEQKLVEVFGDQYRAYMATTGRFVPKLWAVHK